MLLEDSFKRDLEKQTSSKAGSHQRREERKKVIIIQPFLPARHCGALSHLTTF